MTSTIHYFAHYRPRLTVSPRCADPACVDWRIVTDPDMSFNRRIQACDRLLTRSGLRAAFVAQVQSERQRLARQAQRNVRAAMFAGCAS